MARWASARATSRPCSRRSSANRRSAATSDPRRAGGASGEPGAPPARVHRPRLPTGTSPGDDCDHRRSCLSAGGDRESAAGTVTFTDPADGPEYLAVGTRLVISTGRALTPGDLTVTLAAGPNHTLVGVVTPMPSVDLEPKGTYTTPVTISSAHRDHQVGPQDSLTVSAELLAQGYGPLQRTGVEAHATLRR